MATPLMYMVDSKHWMKLVRQYRVSRLEDLYILSFEFNVSVYVWWITITERHVENI